MAGSATVVQGGRAKAYRPLPPSQRRVAFEAGLAAYARGDFFQAHELLEPAWMGSPDLAERELVQGLIKLAAAYVHDVRGNPAGVAKNLRGARARLVAAVAAVAGPDTTATESDAPRPAEIDVTSLVAAIDARLEAPDVPSEPPAIKRMSR
ncbi:MAG TPA: DUF309 domain-containing protein [Candidatus Limnocylindrales bacterium]|jgi:hypothetical protein